MFKNVQLNFHMFQLIEKSFIYDSNFYATFYILITRYFQHTIITLGANVLHTNYFRNQTYPTRQQRQDMGKNNFQPTDLHIQPADLHIQPAHLHIQPTDLQVQPTDLHIQPTATFDQPTSTFDQPSSTFTANNCIGLSFIGNKSHFI